MVGLFETGKVGGGDPTAVAILPDGAGISYGIHQATDASGSLDAVLLEYLDRGGRMADQIRPYLGRLSANLSAQRGAWVTDLAAVLREAGRDQTMVDAQEAVFRRLYWAPMWAQALAADLRLALSWLALYDTAVQSGPGAIARMRVRFPELPPSRGGDERAWTRAYLEARRRWVAGFEGHSLAHTALVRRTVYRADAMLALVEAGAWDLHTPLQVWGRTITG